MVLLTSQEIKFASWQSSEIAISHNLSVARVEENRHHVTSWIMKRGCDEMRLPGPLIAP
jgi:hypothetical protein